MRTWRDALVTRPPKDTDPALERLLESGASGTSSRRSPLYLWFRRHHRKLAEQASMLGGAPWAEWIAEIQADPRLVDRNGQTPKLRTAQATWYKVCDVVARERTRRAIPRSQSTPADPTPGQIASGVYSINDVPDPASQTSPAFSGQPDQARQTSSAEPPARRVRVATSLPGMPSRDEITDLQKPATPVFQGSKYPKPIR